MDPEALIRGWLSGQGLGARIVTDLPAKFEETLPVVQVTAIGGASTWRPWNGVQPLARQPRMDIDCFATSRAAASDLAAAVEAAVFAARGHGSEWGQVKDVSDSTGPVWRPDYNPNVRRFGFELTLTIRP